MEVSITCSHVNALKSARAKFSDMGDLSHELAFDVLLQPGDLERLLTLFRQRIPITLTISSPQSKFDLMTTIIRSPEEQARYEAESQPEEQAETHTSPDLIAGVIDLCACCALQESCDSELKSTETDKCIACDIYRPTRFCSRCGGLLDPTIDSDICGTCADDLRDEANAQQDQDNLEAEKAERKQSKRSKARA